jgi:AcrR family transcriptional regulator
MTTSPGGACDPRQEPTARRRWRGVDPDARTAARRQCLVEAAVDVLSEEGLTGTTVRAVCSRANLHSRYFYESFESIDALLVAVFDDLSERFLGEITAAADAAGEDPRARLRRAVRTAAEIVVRETPLIRILAVETTANANLNRRRIKVLHDIAAMIEKDAYRLYGPPPPGERIGTISARFLAAGLSDLLVAWADGELEGDAEQLAADATELMLAVSERAREIAASRAGRRRSPRKANAGESRRRTC